MTAGSDQGSLPAAEGGLLEWTRSWGWLVVAAFLALHPFGTLYELPVALMAAMGLVLLCTRPRTVVDAPFFKALVLIGLCLWIPMLVSLPDAVNLPRSAKTTAAFLRFPLLAVFVCFALQSDAARGRLLWAVGWILSIIAVCAVLAAFWTAAADWWAALLEAVGKQRAMGHKLAALAIVFFCWAIAAMQIRKFSAIWIPVFIAAVLLSGARVAWLMLALSIALVLAWMLVYARQRIDWRMLAAVALLSVLAIGAAAQHPAFESRLHRAAEIFGGDYESFSRGSSQRLPIWEVAAEVVKANWINGVGPRGFRSVFADYAAEDNFFVLLGGSMPTHPHMTVLEIAAETGVIGLAGYLLLLGLWLRLMLRCARAGQTEALAWMGAVMIAIMPFNAHMAFYGSFWSGLVWWLMAIALAHAQPVTPNRSSG